MCSEVFAGLRLGFDVPADAKTDRIRSRLVANAADNRVLTDDQRNIAEE
jgi:hypothetical protein